MKQQFRKIIPFLMAAVLFVQTMPATFAAGSEITVSFRLIGDTFHGEGVTGHGEYVTWIPTTLYTVEAGATVGDVFLTAIEEHGMKQKGAASGYVEAVRAPAVLGGYWLGEFDNGSNSGWMYTINGDHPGVGLTNRTLKDGDEVVWHYVDDYVLEERDPNSVYYGRWLEAADITPQAYLWQSCKLERTDQESYLLSMAAVPENLLIIVAGYHETGQMADCQVITQSDISWEPGTVAEKAVSVQGKTASAFVLDGDTFTLIRVLEL